MYQSIPSASDAESQPFVVAPHRPIRRKPLPQNRSFEISSTQTLDNARSEQTYLNRAAHDESEPANASHQSLISSENDNLSRYRSLSIWTRYNPFNRSGRSSLHRKLLSSGPAIWAENEFDDDVNKEKSVPVERRAGWQKGTWACCFAVTVCIVIELVLLIWATSTSIGGSGSGLLYEGSCDKAKNMAIWLLLPLNIAATILISTSNYVMQIMTAPSRSEIDQAHQSAKAVVVCGMSSHFLKFDHRGRMRRNIWWLLVLSSLPIHLLLNSAIYSSVQASNTGVLVVSNGFEEDLAWNQCNSNVAKASSSSFSFACSLMSSYKNGYTRQLSRQQCISQYANGFQTNASSVIVVAEAGSNPWYSPPQAHAVPSSYGIACQSNNGSTITYYPVADSKRYFKFDYSPQAGYVNVSLPFSLCTNNTQKDKSTGLQTWSLNRTDNGGTISSYNSTKGFFFTATNASFHDPLLNITSIRAVFDAINYRYWAAAQSAGDYLNPSYQTLSHGWDTRSWLCSGDDLKAGIQCDATKLLAKSDWKITPSDIPVIGCHVYHKDEKCTLRYSWRILLVTILCDITKLLAMLAALRFISNPLTTIGDVISSFLQNPDPCTERRCLLDDKAAKEYIYFWSVKKHAVKSHLERMREGSTDYKVYQSFWRSFNIPYGHLEPNQFDKDAEEWLGHGGSWWTTVDPVATPQEWVSRTRRWYVVLSKARWYAFAFLYSSSALAAVIYFALGITSLQGRRISSIWTAGLSGPDPNALWEGGLMSGATSITGAAVLVNFPQLLFSMLYFAFNALLTTMHTAHEWANFAKYRKALRVSSPRGQQRSTYWLQLPWSYSFPLIVASGSLHWLLGRSIYLVKVEIYGYFGERQASEDFFACGYSPITTLALILLLACMGLALLILAFRKLESGSPLVLCNSFAISAACHPDPSEKDVALRPLMWGVVRDEDGLETQHCSFSKREVSPLQEGQFYS